MQYECIAQSKCGPPLSMSVSPKKRKATSQKQEPPTKQLLLCDGTQKPGTKESLLSEDDLDAMRSMLEELSEDSDEGGDATVSTVDPNIAHSTVVDPLGDKTSTDVSVHGQPQLEMSHVADP
jgi:hypothetical protein